MEKKKWIAPLLSEELMEETLGGLRSYTVEAANLHT